MKCFRKVLPATHSLNKLYSNGDGELALMCQHAAGLMHAGKIQESVNEFTKAAIVRASPHMHTYSRTYTSDDGELH